MDQPPTYWGLSACIDLYGGDLSRMQNPEVIEEFVQSLCEQIRMRRFGKTYLVYFGEEARVAGFSMMQLIETSLISAHFADATRAIYLDVFSCASYAPETVAAYAAEFFKAERYHLQVVQRR